MYFQGHGVPTTKFCRPCNTTLCNGMFSSNKKASDGLQTTCKKCTALYMTQRREAIKRKQIEQPDAMATCSTCGNQKALSAFTSGNLAKCKACSAEYMRQQIAANIHTRIRNALRSRIWYAVKRSKTSLVESGTEKVIGCSVQELKEYLEKQFEPDMTWDNYGRLPHQWEIDHRRACKHFDLRNAEEQRQCFHYTNMQPLWMPLNRSKSYL